MESKNKTRSAVNHGIKDQETKERYRDKRKCGNKAVQNEARNHNDVNSGQACIRIKDDDSDEIRFIKAISTVVRQEDRIPSIKTVEHNRKTCSADRMIGCKEDDIVYLMPKCAYEFAKEYLARIHRSFKIPCERTIVMQMRKSGLLMLGTRNQSKVRMTINGKRQLFYKLSMDVITQINVWTKRGR